MIMRAILTATVMVATLLGAASAAMALDDPTITCNQTNDPWGSEELCYTGPRTPQSALARSHADEPTAAPTGHVRVHPHRRVVKHHP
jgi:hypothetical protein